MSVALHEVCAVACAEVWRGGGEILASPIGVLPTLGARLARLTFSPDLLLTDGVSLLLAEPPPLSGPRGPLVVEGWMPFSRIFDVVWWGRRHVMMGATQIDQYGNQNIACIGPWEKPKAQLLGMRGAPGNTVHHATSYWVPSHTRRVFVEAVDVVSGVGFQRARELGTAGRFHDLRRVVSNLGVFDFGGPERGMRLLSAHPGVKVEDIIANTSFPLAIPDDPPTTRPPTSQELHLIRNVLDPEGIAAREIR